MKNLREKAEQKIAALLWQGVDYQTAVNQVLYESEEFADLLEGMNDDEKFDEANDILSEASLLEEEIR